MSKMKAAVVDPGAPGHIAVREVEAPTPGTSEALVRNAVTSLNYGEVHLAQGAEPGSPIGWDVAGTVEKAAADGTGPREGARVVGYVRTGAWAELVAVPTNALAEVPDEVSLEQAATLPVAGLTALLAVAKGGDLLGRRALVTGASGGVGHIACQLANLAGAFVVAQVRRESEKDMVSELGARQVIVSEDASEAGEAGPYKLIVDGVGGKVITNVIGMLDKGGICVAYGGAAGSQVSFEIWDLTAAGRASLYGLSMPREVQDDPASQGLARLVQLVAEGRLRSHISDEATFEKIGEMAQALMDRKIRGKAVIHI